MNILYLLIQEKLALKASYQKQHKVLLQRLEDQESLIKNIDKYIDLYKRISNEKEHLRKYWMESQHVWYAKRKQEKNKYSELTEQNNRLELQFKECIYSLSVLKDIYKRHIEQNRRDQNKKHEALLSEIITIRSYFMK